MIFYITQNPICLHTTQANAKAVNKSFEQIDIPTDKTGLMAFVQELYDRAVFDVDNFPEGLTPPPTHQSVHWDEDFDKLPVAHQLHFAARAMENAREAL